MVENDRSIGNDETVRGSGSAVLARIDKYEILRKLGGGGFGSVYLARDNVSGVEVAVKGLPPVVKNNTEELERIRENFALVSRLHHPYIAAALNLHLANEVVYNDARVHDDLNVAAGDTLMVMEYAPGVTLSQWVKQFPGKKVPIELAIKIATQIADALDYAHGRHILHRDIKPSNIMIETDGAELTARVLDFGLAAEIRSSLGRISREIHDTSGTRPYMAPEQWAGEKQDSGTDQYALAVLFCELVTGVVPFASVFECGDPAVMMTAVCSRVPVLPDECPSRGAVLKAMARNASARFETCADFIASIKGVPLLRRPRFKALRDGLISIRGCICAAVRKAWKPVAFAVVLLAVGYGGYWWWDNYVPVASEVWKWNGPTTQSERSAIEYFRQDKYAEGYAIAQGLDTKQPELLFYLGKCYDGFFAKIPGVEKDLARAFECYLHSAEAGYAPSMFPLGSMYANGEGCEVSHEECLRWCKEGAKQKYPRCVRGLAQCYIGGEGVQKDLACGEKLLKKAASMGDLIARVMLGDAYISGQFGITNAYEGARLHLQAAKAGCGLGMHRIGRDLMFGFGVQIDLPKAVYWLRKGCVADEPEAMTQLGCALLSNDEIRDEDEGYRWLTAAVAKGDETAMWFLARYYENGFDGANVKIPQDYKKALEMYRKISWGEDDAKRVRRIMELMGYKKIDYMTDEERSKYLKEEAERQAAANAESIRQEKLREEEERVAAAKRKQEAEKAAEVKALADKIAAEKAAAEKERQETESELEAVMNAANKIFADLKPTTRFDAVVADLRKLDAKHIKAKALITSFVEETERMAKTEKYIWDNVRGYKLSTPYDGIVESYKASSASLVLRKKQGKTAFSTEIPRAKFFSERALFELLTNGIILNGKKGLKVGSVEWAELVVGVALITKHFPCGESTRDARIRALIERVIDGCPEYKNNKLMIKEFLPKELNEVEEARRPPTTEEAYAKALIGSFPFDIRAHFQIGPSLRSRLRSMKVVDDAWVNAANAKAAGRYLDALSVMAGRTISAYPVKEEIDRIFESFRNQNRRIVLIFNDSYDYVKCFTISHHGTNRPEAEEQGRLEKIDDQQGVLYASVGDGKKYLTTLSVYYGLRTLAYGDYTSKRRSLEKKLENKLIGKQEFEAQILSMNKTLYESMLKKAKTE